MCDYRSFRDGQAERNDEDVRPRTAEEIYEASLRKRKYRCENKHATGTDMLEDVFR